MAKSKKEKCGPESDMPCPPCVFHNRRLSSKRKIRLRGGHRGTAMRLYLAHALSALASAKRCDVFTVPGVGERCGPALFLPAFGKCGTNAIREYTSLHPMIRWPRTPEPWFDPKDVNPLDFVSSENPGVTPQDELVWMVKAPATASSAGQRSRSTWLAVRLHRAYPSAAVLMTFCDPVLQPWRWFRHYITRSVGYGIDRPEAEESPLNVDPPAGLLLAPLSDIVARSAGLGGPGTLRGMYEALMPVDDDCRLSAPARFVAEGLCRIFENGGGLFYCSAGDTFGLFGGELATTCLGDDVRGTLCERSRRVAFNMDEFASAFISAGYRVGRSLDAVYMEEWEGRGEEQMLSILRLVGVDEKQFPWERTNGFKPVYSIKGDSSDETAPQSTALDQEARRVCCNLGHSFGRLPTWPACAALTLHDEGGKLPCQISSPPPPLTPAPSPPSPPSPPGLPMDHLRCYVLLYRDMRDAFCDGDLDACDWAKVQAHWDKHGRERRTTECAPPPPPRPPGLPADQLRCYVLRNRDLLDAFCRGDLETCRWGQVQMHWALHGTREARPAECSPAVAPAATPTVELFLLFETAVAALVALTAALLVLAACSRLGRRWSTAGLERERRERGERLAGRLSFQKLQVRCEAVGEVEAG